MYSAARFHLFSQLVLVPMAAHKLECFLNLRNILVDVGRREKREKDVAVGTDAWSSFELVRLEVAAAFEILNERRAVNLRTKSCQRKQRHCRVVGVREESGSAP